MTHKPAWPTCPVCTRPFPPRRRPGGKPKGYCSPACRHRHREARTAFTAALEAAGTVTTEMVLAALEDAGTVTTRQVLSVLQDQTSPCHPHRGAKQ